MHAPFSYMSLSHGVCTIVAHHVKCSRASNVVSYAPFMMFIYTSNYSINVLINIKQIQ